MREMMQDRLYLKWLKPELTYTLTYLQFKLYLDAIAVERISFGTFHNGQCAKGLRRKRRACSIAAKCCLSLPPSIALR